MRETERASGYWSCNCLLVLVLVLVRVLVLVPAACCCSFTSWRLTGTTPPLAWLLGLGVHRPTDAGTRASLPRPTRTWGKLMGPPVAECGLLVSRAW